MDVLQPIYDTFKDSAQQLAIKIATDFNNIKSMSAQDLLTQITSDVLVSIIETMKQVVHKLLDSVKWLVDQLSALGNYQ